MRFFSRGTAISDATLAGTIFGFTQIKHLSLFAQPPVELINAVLEHPDRTALHMMVFYIQPIVAAAFAAYFCSVVPTIGASIVLRCTRAKDCAKK